MIQSPRRRKQTLPAGESAHSNVRSLRPNIADPREDPSLLGQFIPLHYHSQMLRDSVRLSGFREALENLVPQGGRVLELGGGTGVLSFFAAKRASKVWCVEKLPEIVRAARRFIAMNHCQDRVEIIEGDAMEYLPPQPVDVVVCEMLHSALLREKQTQIVASFKERYLAKFGTPLPMFVPEATILAVQAVQQSYDFHGYVAPVPMFYDPSASQTETLGLAEPSVYNIFQYREDVPQRYDGNIVVPIQTTGSLNALRFITKNILAIVVREKRTVDWHNQYLVLPVPDPIYVDKSDQVRITFQYEAGASITSLIDSIQVHKIKP